MGSLHCKSDKTAQAPVICICNDRMAQKMKPLVNICYDIRVKRPPKGSIAKRLVQMGQAEGMVIDSAAAELMAEQCGNDIRQTIHALQMWRMSSDNLNYMDLKSDLKRIEKDKILRSTAFDACGMILRGAGRDDLLTDRYNSFFIDYSLVPLLVQQNYIESCFRK